jgi:hypothetical protein
MNHIIPSYKKETLKYQIEIMQDLIPCLKGKYYSEAKSNYLKLLRTYETDFGKSELIYLKRSE